MTSLSIHNTQSRDSIYLLTVQTSFSKLVLPTTNQLMTTLRLLLHKAIPLRIWNGQNRKFRMWGIRSWQQLENYEWFYFSSLKAFLVWLLNLWFQIVEFILTTTRTSHILHQHQQSFARYELHSFCMMWQSFIPSFW